MSIPARYKYLRNEKTMRKYLWNHYSYYENGEQKMTERGVEIAGELGIMVECPLPLKNTTSATKKR